MRDAIILGVLTCTLLVVSMIVLGPWSILQPGQEEPGTGFWLNQLPAWSLPSSRHLQPLDVALDGRGHLHVVDGRTNALMEFDAEGRFLRSERHRERLLVRPFVGSRLSPVSIVFNKSRTQRFSVWAHPNGMSANRIERIRCTKGSRIRVDQLVDDHWENEKDLRSPWATGLYHDIVYDDSNERFGVYGYNGGAGCPSDPYRDFLDDFGTDGILVPRHAYLYDGRLAWTMSIGPMSVATETIALDGIITIAPAAAENGGLNVLVRPEQPDPAADHIRQFDRNLQPVGALNIPGIPHPPDIEWPWNLSSGQDGSHAFTTAGDVFEVHRVAEDGSPIYRIVGAPSFEPYRAHGSELAEFLPAAPVAIAPFKGGVVAVDDRAYQLVAFDVEGFAVADEGGRRYLDVASDGEAIYAVTASELFRFDHVAPGALPTWRVPCACDTGSRVDATRRRVYVSSPAARQVLLVEPRNGQQIESFHLPGSGPWPADIAALPDRLLSLDEDGHTIQVWSTGDSPESSFSVGLGSMGRRISATGGEATSVSVLKADGAIEEYDSSTGDLRAEWKPMLATMAPFVARDLALEDDGQRAFLVDPSRAAVQIFERSSLPASPTPSTPTPRGRVTRTPTLRATFTPTPRACVVTGNKVANPSRVAVGDVVTVSLHVQAACPDRLVWDSLDLVVILDRSGSMQGGKWELALRILQEVLGGTAELGPRVGLVAFGEKASLVLPFSPDTRSVLVTARGLEARGETNLRAALDEARTLIANRGNSGALPSVLLISDGNATSRGNQEAAALLAEAGAATWVVSIGDDADVEQLRSWFGDGAVVEADRGGAVTGRLVEQIRASVRGATASDWRISDEIGPDLRLVGESIRPAAIRNGAILHWHRPILPREGISLSFQLQALKVGRFDTNIFASADYLDADGQPGRFVFPVPQIEVFRPSATPTPSRTPTPSHTPLPTATATRPSVPVYLPLVLREPPCESIGIGADVVLLIDTSMSMTGSNLEAARRAALGFAEAVNPNRDRLAVVSFSDSAQRMVGLTLDRDRVRLALSQLVTSPGTRIDHGLALARNELETARRADGLRAIVLLTDGRQSDATLAIEEAELARKEGAVVHVIGLGSDTDAEQLRQIAGSPENYRPASRNQDLSGMYKALAREIPCPRRLFWGRR